MVRYHSFPSLPHSLASHLNFCAAVCGLSLLVVFLPVGTIFPALVFDSDQAQPQNRHSRSHEFVNVASANNSIRREFAPSFIPPYADFPRGTNTDSSETSASRNSGVDRCFSGVLSDQRAAFGVPTALAGFGDPAVSPLWALQVRRCARLGQRVVNLAF